MAEPIVPYVMVGSILMGQRRAGLASQPESGVRVSDWPPDIFGPTARVISEEIPDAVFELSCISGAANEKAFAPLRSTKSTRLAAATWGRRSASVRTKY